MIKIEESQPKRERDLFDYVRFAFVIIAVVALGLFIINSVMDYRYKVVFIKQPCSLCVDLNPELKSCMTQKQSLYPDGSGGWRYENGTPYNGYMPTNQFSVNLSALNP